MARVSNRDQNQAGASAREEVEIEQTIEGSSDLQADLDSIATASSRLSLMAMSNAQFNQDLAHKNAIQNQQAMNELGWAVTARSVDYVLQHDVWPKWPYKPWWKTVKDHDFRPPHKPGSHASKDGDQQDAGGEDSQSRDEMLVDAIHELRATLKLLMAG